MSTVPIDVLVQNSVLLRYVALSPVRSVESLPEQLELLRANHGHVSLGWRSFSPSELPGMIQDALEHLQMGAYRKPTIHTAIQELTGSDGVRSHTLKKLTFFKVIKYRNNIGPPISMFRQCPQVERMHLNVIIAAGSSDIFETDQEPNFDIHKTVLAWKSRSHGASLDTADDTAVTTDAKVETSTDSTEMPQNTYEDLKKFGCPHWRSLPRVLPARLSRFGDSLGVGGLWDPEVVISLMNSFKHTLRHVDLETIADVKASSSFETLS
ncbi:hypothetical protein BGZ52_009880 [Haplosporangium bisporale]|nr:hypothetical protein BGZ52_009880 [Haplosporangium bisporale]